ncbi:MAG: hypothetical protein KAW17_13070 [Candidatus Eisenbacteria sp.]|nr:hypothetical protein [Candidatus Eisenbacteria bacterium]
MSTKIALVVRLKVPDTTALSAEDVLRRKMGYGDRLGRLRREDWWLFEVDTGDGARARARVGEWARRCTSLVNPNKHRARVELPREKSGSGSGVRVLVRDRDDVRARSMLAFLRYSLGASDLLSLRSGTLWTVEPGAGEKDPRSLAEGIAATRSRRRGLLANPHAQTFEIYG